MNVEIRQEEPTIEVQRDGKWLQLRPEDLTTAELIEHLSYITIDSDEFISQKEINQGYAAINEAIRRLEAKSDGSVCKSTRCG